MSLEEKAFLSIKIFLLNLPKICILHLRFEISGWLRLGNERGSKGF